MRAAWSGRTGVEALVTDHTTVLDDGTHVDPAGDGYLLLRSRQRGRSAAIAVTFVGPFDLTGFAATAAAASGAE